MITFLQETITAKMSRFEARVILDALDYACRNFVNLDQKRIETMYALRNAFDDHLDETN